MTARWRSRALLLGFWVLPALVATLGFRVVPSRYNPTLSLWGIFLSQLLIWGAWGVWSLVIVAVSDRVPLERGRLLAAIAAHLPLSVVVIGAQIVVTAKVSAGFSLIARPPVPLHLDSVLAIGLRSYGDLLIVVYVAVVGAHAAFRWHARWREETLRAERLNADLAHASLQALQAQLNPHFLFNALNAIVTLIGRDRDAAERTTVRLAELLRATLAAGAEHECTLAEEQGLTARYLEIESVRFADRLHVRWEIPAELRAAIVPTFALQPLVENAIRHGIAQRAGPGTIEIAAHAERDVLHLSVRDDGVGLGAPPLGEGAGIALANLRARLERLYGSAAALTLRPRSDGPGTEADVRLPLRSADP
ncbi:MAG: histidine kinase [Gemmatimonadaceae bacterium]|nr:histidine kinase [Gemmatimonadaceae bacterium]